MGNYSFTLNTGKAFDYESPVLENIKGLFASKKKQKKKDEMFQKAKNIFKKYSIELTAGVFGSRLSVEADSQEDADNKIKEAVDELKKWYSEEFNLEQEFGYRPSQL